MEAEIERLKWCFENRNHIKKLLSGRKMHIQFTIPAGHEEWLLRIGDDGISYGESQCETAHMKLIAEGSEFSSLLQGRLPLRTGMDEGRIVFKGTFRQSLLLESLLLLCTAGEDAQPPEKPVKEDCVDGSISP
ncbi:MAG TPA: SCP2 sterol-binding domain-containing protein [Bacillaceae bacterium]